MIVSTDKNLIAPNYLTCHLLGFTVDIGDMLSRWPSRSCYSLIEPLASFSWWWLKISLSSFPLKFVQLGLHFTYDHRYQRTRRPVRSALSKLVTGQSVVKWVTISESWLSYVFAYASFFWASWHVSMLGLRWRIYLWGCLEASKAPTIRSSFHYTPLPSSLGSPDVSYATNYSTTTPSKVSVLPTPKIFTVLNPTFSTLLFNYTTSCVSSN